METITDLNSKTLDKLHDLVQMNVDSCEGFQEAAEKIENPLLERSFNEFSHQRQDNVNQLKQYLKLNDDFNGKEKGSFSADLHRIWMGIREKLSSDNVAVILSEAERGEDHIKNLYEDVLKEIPGTPLNGILQRQYTDIKKSHDQIKELRDAQ
jgi:uncharacterized protein (TIGR02284 family)